MAFIEGGQGIVTGELLGGDLLETLPLVISTQLGVCRVAIKPEKAAASAGNFGGGPIDDLLTEVLAVEAVFDRQALDVAGFASLQVAPAFCVFPFQGDGADDFVVWFIAEVGCVGRAQADHPDDALLTEAGSPGPVTVVDFVSVGFGEYL